MSLLSLLIASELNSDIGSADLLVIISVGIVCRPQFYSALIFPPLTRKTPKITRQQNAKSNAKSYIYLAKKRKKQYLCGVNLNHIPHVPHDRKRSF